MTTEPLRTICNAQPFRPFVLRLADGRESPFHITDLEAKPSAHEPNDGGSNNGHPD